MPLTSKKSNIPKARTDFYRNCRIPYEAQAIREANSYGPLAQKYDKYIELWEDDYDPAASRSGQRRQYVQEKLSQIKKKELESIPETPASAPKCECKPIIHCYTDINNTVTAKKSTPIKKISFALPKNEKVLKPMDWNDYHTLEVIHQFMDDLESEFPSICSTASIGKSVEGRNLKILKISNSNASNLAVWVDAGIHAREWIAPAVNTYIANYISRNFGNLPDSVTNKDWYFLPVVNPDGYHYSHTTDRLWRKNRAWHLGQRSGVDLNRNFSYGWGGKGSSGQPTSAFYKGPHPFSEPESTAMRDTFLNSGIKFQVYITLHSYGQIIIFPYACTTAMAPDYVRLLEGATEMSKAIYNTNGEIYKVGVSRDVMYGASGTSNDFAHGVADIPFCYLIELRSKKHKFKLPKEEIEDTANEILSGVLALMEFVDTQDDQPFDLLMERNESYLNGSCAVLNKSNTSVKKLTELVKVAPTPSNSQLWEVKFLQEGQRQFVKTLDTLKAINIWKEERSTMEIMVDGSRTAQVAGIFHERDIPYSIAVADIASLLDKDQSTSYSIGWTKSSNENKKMDWQSYHTLETIYNFMDNLETEFPYLCSVHVIGKSVEGRDMKMLKISNGESTNEGVWMDGAIHAREWISPAVVTYLADRIARTFSELPEYVTNKDWYILPVLNPDGYEYTHTHDRMWRKNRARFGECVGVDLNRNFSYGFGEKGEEGSSEDPGNVFYRGPKAFSEPETAAVKRAITSASSTFKVFLSFHSYGEVIIFPWGYTSDSCPDYVELLEGGTAMAKAIFNTNGHTYKVGSTKDLMYYAAGTSIDWAYAVCKIPYSYMVELRSKTHRFLLPKEEIISTAIEIQNGVFRLLAFVDQKCTGSETCACAK